MVKLIAGDVGFIILFSLFLHTFEKFHNKKLKKERQVSRMIRHLQGESESWTSVLKLAAQSLQDAFSFKRQTPENTGIWETVYFFSDV